MRYALAAEGCKDCDAFGGLCAQRNLLSAAPNLAVTEGVSLGNAYCRTPIIHLEWKARKRAVSSDEFHSLLSPEQIEVDEQARRERSLSARSGLPKEFANGGNPSLKPAWDRPTSDSLPDPSSASKADPYRLFGAPEKGFPTNGKGRWIS